jgi:hypothetical protein
MGFASTGYIAAAFAAVGFLVFMLAVFAARRAKSG